MKKSRKKSGRDLSLRERKLVKGVLDGKNLTQAALGAGYAKSTVNAKVKELVGKRRVYNALVEVMKKIGIDDNSLAVKLQEGLNAKKVVSARIVEREAGGADNDFIEVPDFAVRFKYLELALKLRGQLQPETYVHQTITYEQRILQIAQRAEARLHGKENAGN